MIGAADDSQLQQTRGYLEAVSVAGRSARDELLRSGGSRTTAWLRGFLIGSAVAEHDELISTLRAQMTITLVTLEKHATQRTADVSEALASTRECLRLFSTLWREPLVSECPFVGEIELPN